MKIHGLILAVALLGASEHPASALDCSTLTNPIYLQVGDTQVNLMRSLGRKLRDNAAKPITLVWFASGSCANIDLIYNHNPAAGITATMSYVPSTAEDATWSPANATASPALSCVPPTTTPLFPDIANSALFNAACATIAQTNPNVAVTRGPIQAYVLAVPEASNEHVITFEEGYFVFGFGAGSMISPWNDPMQMFIRTTTKSTLLAWAAQLTIPANKMQGKPEAASTTVVTDLQTSPTPAKAIGILGVEVYDALRSSLNALAYRAKDQYAAYYPDSTASTFDKQNVRDGHYVVWSPTIWMDNVAGTTPTKPDARYVIDLIAGKVVTPQPSFPATDVVAGVGLVPDCAMGVTRDFEQGPLRLYTPAASCTCRYEFVTTGVTSCNHCDATTPCTGTAVCRDSYCEAR